MERKLMLEKLAILWDKYPCMRLGQLISNLTRPSDSFYTEDDVLYDAIVHAIEYEL